MTSTLKATALAAAAIAVLAAPVAEARTGQSSMKDIKKVLTVAKKQGGFGNPIVEVPRAIFDAMGDAAQTMTGSEDTAEADAQVNGTN